MKHLQEWMFVLVNFRSHRFCQFDFLLTRLSATGSPRMHFNIPVTPFSHHSNNKFYCKITPMKVINTIMASFHDFAVECDTEKSFHLLTVYLFINGESMNYAIILSRAMNTWPTPYIFRDTWNLPRTYSTP